MKTHARKMDKRGATLFLLLYVCTPPRREKAISVWAHNVKHRVLHGAFRVSHGCCHGKRNFFGGLTAIDVL